MKGRNSLTFTEKQNTALNFILKWAYFVGSYFVRSYLPCLFRPILYLRHSSKPYNIQSNLGSTRNLTLDYSVDYECYNHFANIYISRLVLSFVNTKKAYFFNKWIIKQTN